MRQTIDLNAHVPPSLHLWMGELLRRRLVHLPTVPEECRSQSGAGTHRLTAFDTKQLTAARSTDSWQSED